LKAQIQLTVFQYETNKEYGGDARISILDKNIRSTFSFQMKDPNDVKKFRVVIQKNGGIVLAHAGHLGVREQIDSYTETQIAIFTLLYKLIHDGVKEAQRLCGGTTCKNPVEERVNEAIRIIGKEPVASISFCREFSWREKDREMFERLCAAL